MTTSIVLAWPNHKYHGPWCCNGDGQYSQPDGCVACILSVCTVCHGAEGELPSNCPGRSMSHTERDLVMAGKLDFKGTKWVLKVGVA